MSKPEPPAAAARPTPRNPKRAVAERTHLVACPHCTRVVAGLAQHIRSVHRRKPVRCAD